MRFGPLPVARAEGALLAHSLRRDGLALGKGHRLTAADLERLRALGLDTVTVARLEPGDVHEDEAAARVARAMAGPWLRATPAATGRVNLHSTARGLAVIDAGAIGRINALDEAVTVATLPPHDPVAPERMVATIKIIPFAAPAAAVARAEAVAAEGPAPIRVAPFRPLAAGLIQTRLDGTLDKVLDKTRTVTAERLAGLGGRLAAERRCRHDTDALAAAIAALLREAVDLVLIAGASAVTDRRDVLPAAIAAAGGTVEHLGMPVDPGNLLVLGRIGPRPVLGLPGCARSPRLNGIDWVLQRLAAGLPVGGPEIMGLGVGGLLTESPGRPLPRARAPEAAGTGTGTGTGAGTGAETETGAGTETEAGTGTGTGAGTETETETGPGAGADPATEVRPAPRVAALVLAAGRSSRMGGANKLLAPIGDRPMLARVIDQALASRADPVIVVTGHEAGRVEALLAGRPVAIVRNPDFAEGLSRSLRAGLEALPGEVDAALVCLGDMPAVTAAQLDRLIAAYDPAAGRAIAVPARDGRRGNPVLWDKRFFPAMAAVRGDTGARHLIGEHAEWLVEVPMDDDAVLADIDTPEALAAATAAGDGAAMDTADPGAAGRGAAERP